MRVDEYPMFTVVCWPEIQALMEEPGFWEHCHLINDASGLEQFGPQAYFCEVAWLNKF